VILVDTYVVVWLAFDQAQLSRNARAAINDARQKGEGLAISDITLLELATLSNHCPKGSLTTRSQRAAARAAALRGDSANRRSIN